MTKYRLIGILSCVAGGVLIGFQTLSGVMGTKTSMQSSSLMDVVGPQYLEWVGNTSFFGLEKIAETIVTMPLFVLMFGIGGLFFVLDYFLGRR
ncbi:MAG: hypothetical protein AB1427_02870 [Thermodesulfobacteriota bacterium]